MAVRCAVPQCGSRHRSCASRAASRPICPAATKLPISRLADSRSLRRRPASSRSAMARPGPTKWVGLSKCATDKSSRGSTSRCRVARRLPAGWSTNTVSRWPAPPCSRCRCATSTGAWSRPWPEMEGSSERCSRRRTRASFASGACRRANISSRQTLPLAVDRSNLRVAQATRRPSIRTPPCHQKRRSYALKSVKRRAASRSC